MRTKDIACGAERRTRGNGCRGRGIGIVQRGVDLQNLGLRNRGYDHGGGKRR